MSAGAKKVLPFVSLERRQDLLGAMTTLNKRVTSRSPVKIVVLDFIANIFASPGIFLQPNAGLEPVVSEQEACLWLQVCMTRKALQSQMCLVKSDGQT